MDLRSVFVFIMVLGFSEVQLYKIPNVHLELLNDGFRVSIPDEIGIKNVAFNVNRNKKFKSFSQGEFSTQVRSTVDRRWSHEFKYPLNPDDTIFIWTNVQHNQVIYRDISDPINVCQLDLERCKNPNSVIENKVVSPPITNNQEVTPRPQVVPQQPVTEPVVIPVRQPPVVSRPPVETSCIPSETLVPYRTVCKGELIFEDNFDSLNGTIWTHEVRAPLDTGDAEFVLYDTEATVDNGILSITPKLWTDYSPDNDIRYGHLDLGSRCTGSHNRRKECVLITGGQSILPPVIVPRINTKYSFNFQYGRIEIRAKLPIGDWLSPLLLLEPYSEFYGQVGYESGQIRVAFARGNKALYQPNGKLIDGRILYGGAVLFLDPERRDEFMTFTRRARHFGSEFHVYGLEWNSEKLLLTVDNQIYGEVPGGFSAISSSSSLENNWKRGGYMAPFDRPFYITLGLSAGGFGDFLDDVKAGGKLKPWENKHPKAQLNFWESKNVWKPEWTSPELQVDYVRVYAV